MQSEPHLNIYLVTGKVHSGKTSFVSGLVQRLKKEHIPVSGFLSEGTFTAGRRSSFSLVNVEDGKQHLLATVETRKGWFRFRSFYFNPEALKEGEKIIAGALEKRVGLVVVDEVGPLELEGGGWIRVLEHLDREYENIQLWVVRKQILEIVLEKWNIPADHVITIDQGEEEGIINKIKSHVRDNEIGQAG